MKFLTIRPTVDPLAVLRRRMQEHLNRLIDAGTETRLLDSRVAGCFPLINLSETEDAYHLFAEVPGVRAEDLDIDLSEEGLAVECRRNWPEGTREDHFRRQERWRGSARRELSFVRRVKPEEATAELYAGVLTMRIPKAEPARRRKIDVTKK